MFCRIYLWMRNRSFVTCDATCVDLCRFLHAFSARVIIPLTLQLDVSNNLCKYLYTNSDVNWSHVNTYVTVPTWFPSRWKRPRESDFKFSSHLIDLRISPKYHANKFLCRIYVHRQTSLVEVSSSNRSFWGTSPDSRRKAPTHCRTTCFLRCCQEQNSSHNPQCCLLFLHE